MNYQISHSSKIISHSSKKDEKLRLYGDYRRLNSVTEDDPYCLSWPDKLLDKMGKAHYITTLDMRKDYYQVPMD